MSFTSPIFGGLFSAVYPCSISLISFIGSIQAEYLVIASSLHQRSASSETICAIYIFLKPHELLWILLLLFFLFRIYRPDDTSAVIDDPRLGLCSAVEQCFINSQSHLFFTSNFPENFPIFQKIFQPKNLAAHTRVLLCILMTLAPKFRWTRQV